MEHPDLIRHYAALQSRYRLPEQMHGAGTVQDPKTGTVLAIGFQEHRETYAQCGYLCKGEAPELLHASVCALLEMVQDMPVIKTCLLSPQTLLDKLYPDGGASEQARRCCAMALAALQQAFQSYLQGVYQQKMPHTPQTEAT